MGSLLSKPRGEDEKHGKEDTDNEYVLIELLTIFPSSSPFYTSDDIRFSNETTNFEPDENRENVPPSSQKTTTGEKEKFEAELDKAVIHWPGGAEIKFDQNNALMEFVKIQYPEWKKPGNKISIPCVKIPRIMIRNVDLSKELQTYYKSLVKGEEGENKIYKLFTNEVLTEDAGIIIFPNIDGSHLFEEGGPGSVEIDMIVAHPQKGLFIFNVKNKTIKKGKETENLKQETMKHAKFLGFLSLYSTPCVNLSDNSCLPLVPIHAVICYIPGDNTSIAKLSEDSTWYANAENGARNKVLVFQKASFKNFASAWKDSLQEIPDMTETYHFDVLVARLVALNSMGGASSLIHQKFDSNEIQSIQVEKNKLNSWIEKQFSEVLTDQKDDKQDLMCRVKEQCHNTKSKKTRVILWTKEQLDIIAAVFVSLQKSSTTTLLSNAPKPLRIEINGAKGSGKTMLIIYLAQLACRIFEENGDKQCKVVICDGSRGKARVLFSELKNSLGGASIEFWKLEKLSELQRGIVFIDEELTTSSLVKLFKKINGNCHLCFASSKEPGNFDFRAWKLQHVQEFKLEQTLRSTKQLHAFTENIFRNIVGSHKLTELSGNPPHSLDGTNRADIVYVESAGCLKTEAFIDKCVETIMRYVFLSYEMPSILVMISFLSPKAQISVVARLKETGLTLRSNSYNLDLQGCQILPIIQLESTEFIRGSEFGTVVLLLEKNFNGPNLVEFVDSFFMGITRATTNLAIVVGDMSYFESPLEANEISDSISNLYRGLPCS